MISLDVTTLLLSLLGVLLRSYSLSEDSSLCLTQVTPKVRIDPGRPFGCRIG